MKSQLEIVVFDQFVSAASPAGSCVLAEVSGLSSFREITVFSNQCEAKFGEHLSWIRVPLPKGPIILRYIVFQALAPLFYLRWKLKSKRRSIIQATQGQFIWADIAYAHFCHRAYLKGAWRDSPVRGLRRVARWLTHSFNSYFEKRAFQNARKIVVPSAGLAAELTSQYPGVKNKVVVIANPIDIKEFAPSSSFDREGFRVSLGFETDAVVFCFMALGDFARKGLEIVIDAINGMDEKERMKLRVLVVGGKPAEIDIFRKKAAILRIDSLFMFVGHQFDVRPYLWSSDIFVFPSLYETFSLAIHQAAAAGLPSIVTRGLHGAEEMVRHGENGWLVSRDAKSVRGAIETAIAERGQLLEYGERARSAVQRCDKVEFVARWQRLYSDLDQL